MTMHEDVSEIGSLRRTAFAVAYRMTGDPTEADDLAQDALERWLKERRTHVDKPQAYVATIAARLALNRMRDNRTRKTLLERQQLPVPLISNSSEVDAGLDVSYGLMVLTAQLAPLARAVVVLREGFDLDFADIAVALGKTPANCRQTFRRASRKLMDRNPITSAVAARQAAALQQLTQLIREGDLDGLKAVLAQDVVLSSDGGGIAPAIGRLLTGQDRIARFLIASPLLLPEKFSSEVIEGAVGAFLLLRDEGLILLCVAIDIKGDRVSTIYALSDPRKLAKVMPRR